MQRSIPNDHLQLSTWLGLEAHQRFLGPHRLERPDIPLTSRSQPVNGEVSALLEHLSLSVIGTPEEATEVCAGAS